MGSGRHSEGKMGQPIQSKTSMVKPRTERGAQRRGEEMEKDGMEKLGDYDRVIRSHGSGRQARRRRARERERSSDRALHVDQTI